MDDFRIVLLSSVNQHFLPSDVIEEWSVKPRKSYAASGVNVKITEKRPGANRHSYSLHLSCFVG